MLINKKINIHLMLLKALVLVAPIIVYGYEFAGFSIRLSRLIILMILPFLFFKIITRPYLILRDRFFIFGILPFFIYCTVSVIWAPDQKEAVLRLFALFEMMLVYMAIIVANFNIMGFIRIIKYYIISAIVPVVFSLWQLTNNLFHFSPGVLPFLHRLIPGKYSVLEYSYGCITPKFSRLSSTFAEPNIFGGYLCSVLLLSLILVPKKVFFNITLRLFQILLCIIIVFTLSKSALISLFLGLSVISLKIKRFTSLLLCFLISFLTILGVITCLEYLFIFERLLHTTGHPEYIRTAISGLLPINYLLGKGIGSISYGSTHNFILSRIHEAGFVGFFFSFMVILIPLSIYRLKSSSNNVYIMKIICTGAGLALVFGLCVYDYFIHMFTWIVLGLLMSFYNLKK